MARHRKKMALYEVIASKSVTPKESKKFEQLRPEQKKPETDIAKTNADTSENTVKWPKRPKMLQLNAGRVEISLPYQIAIAVGLGVLLIVALSYRAGQASNTGPQAGFSTPAMPENTAEQPYEEEIFRDSEPTTAVENADPKPANPAQNNVTAQQGDNVIVIQYWENKRELVPVKEFFAKQGIKTEILFIKGIYYLVTKQRYEQNPQTAGTEGYFARQKLIDIGSRYKAPAGYGSFKLDDPYGMMINK